jgi:hypothetical protein
MSRVFTVYNCGTGFNRDRTQEVIANLASRTEGSENRDWMINDGPGSKPGSKATLARTPGLHDPKTGFKTKAPAFAQLKGITEGYGWDHNVEHAMAVIGAIQTGSTTPITTINMSGWSRGAITCHMLAHALAAHPQTQGIKVNIFAFDPVPGPNNFKLEQISLPSNVHHYTAIVMEDEARKIMKPVTFVDSADEESGKKFRTIALPGAHNTAVITLNSEVGTIGAALAHKFLIKHGTRLRAPFLLNDVQYCELYAKVRLDMAKYRGMTGSKAQKKLLGVFKRSVRNDFHDTPYFVNGHHAKRFEKSFPVLWRMMGQGAPDQATVDREATLLRGRAPTTYQSLTALGII